MPPVTPMKRLITLLLTLLCGAVAAAADDSSALIAGVFTPQRLAPDFSIRASDGGELILSHYRGKVVLLSFGYTACTAVCPVTLAVLAQAHKKLGALGDNLQVVYVTVDPERDDAERMHKYLSAFDPSFIGGTGTTVQLCALMPFGHVADDYVHDVSVLLRR
jgi:protein SCO1